MENGFKLNSVEPKLSKSSRIVTMGNESIACAIGLKTGSRTILAWRTMLDAKDISLVMTMSELDFLRDSKKQIEYSNFKGNETIRFCVVRDPIQRFVGTYINKIATNEKWKNKITFDEFFNSYEKNIENDVLGYANIADHISPLSDFYGKDPSVFTHIFNMTQFDDIKEMLEKHSGMILPRLKFNDTSHFSKPLLTDIQISTLKEKYKEDYEIYGRWFI